jgi:hypothetical protein
MNNKSWYGYDLDKTLAYYDKWRDELHIGPPVPAMIAHVKEKLAAGKRVKIFTARIADPDLSDDERAIITKVIMLWSKEYVGVELEVTCEKDSAMVHLYDDRAEGVVANMGITHRAMIEGLWAVIMDVANRTSEPDVQTLLDQTIETWRPIIAKL